ncbi:MULTISPECIES: hypothetical protein [unclassified Photobacterium]|uniref:hypothetical protein n=1 Tax=unclassified Photobacterium TaxID=2628852 RepID=UPI000D173C51|nr:MULTISPECIES: hypothetical protein [unclassified Photobacterium]PSV27764.1 hypothetical protein C9J42_05225 [Photobacterium sp. GB-56]PSV32094.1 hypothetical protein C9J40_06455 [Photobacterium sp. GB-72]PSV38532.1 hypothetical protein C9J38_08635 [Photobacterium sp. GB-210]PSV45879.1 hypothetical protein C9J46_05025 [Photobacterium sp. GB-36]PSV50748.1 hypothetical protein C9J45_18735 [Photobacterium sp. GB-1]
MKTKILLLALLLSGCDMTATPFTPPSTNDIEQCQILVTNKTQYTAETIIANDVDNQSESNRGWVFVDHIKPAHRGDINFRCNLEKNRVEVWAPGAAMWNEL